MFTQNKIYLLCPLEIENLQVQTQNLSKKTIYYKNN